MTALSIPKGLRNLLEGLSRRAVLRRRVPGGDRVPIYVTPAAGLRHWLWDMHKVDKDLFDFALDDVVEGATIWDIGANVGLFSFSAAYRAGSGGAVLAIEPDPWICSLIQRSAARDRRAAKVTALCCAVTGELGIAGFEVGAHGRSSSHLVGAGYPGAGDPRQRFQVMAVTLDWLLQEFAAPDIVKIDVEGAEVGVLEGAQRLLNEIRPKLLIEVAGENSEQVTKILSEADYSLRDLETGRAISMATWLTVATPR